MDLTSAQTELKARGGDYLSSARLTTFLNDAKNELEDFFVWPWLETTTAGTAPLTISDLKHVLYVVDTTNRAELTGASAQYIVEDLDETITTTGTPDVWWLDGTTTLKVYPANTSASLSVRYVKFSPELSAGADTPLIPVRNHNLWIDLAYVRVLKDANDTAEAQALQADCTAKLAKLAETYSVRNRQNSSTYVQLRRVSEDW
jgi:hypothetical protein